MPNLGWAGPQRAGRVRRHLSPIPMRRPGDEQRGRALAAGLALAVLLDPVPASAREVYSGLDAGVSELEGAHFLCCVGEWDHWSSAGPAITGRLGVWFARWVALEAELGLAYDFVTTEEANGGFDVDVLVADVMASIIVDPGWGLYGGVGASFGITYVVATRPPRRRVEYDPHPLSITRVGGTVAPLSFQVGWDKEWRPNHRLGVRWQHKIGFEMRDTLTLTWRWFFGRDERAAAARPASVVP